MKLILYFIDKFIRIDKIILGRWNIENCAKIIDKKIYLANVDHCGTCGNK